LSGENRRGSAPLRDLERDLVSSHSAAVRQDAVRQNTGWKGSFARSARTRRSFRSPRRGPRAGGIKGDQYVIIEDWHRFDYRDDSVKHTASPFRHDLPMASCHFTCVSNSVDDAQSPFRRCYNLPVLTRPGAPPSAPVGRTGRISLVRRARLERPALRNFDTEPHSSYRYEVEPDHRLESIANAHTAADLHVRLVSRTALVSRTWAPRTSLQILHSLFPATEMIRPARPKNHFAPAKSDGGFF